MKKLFALGGSLLFLIGCEPSDDSFAPVFETPRIIELNDSGMFTDDRDGNQYKIVKIGYDYWFAENARYVNKDIKDSTWCYDDKDSNCKKYGRLYAWNVINHVCPEGWSVPSKAQWADFIALVRVSSHNLEDVGTSLKSISGWKEKEGVSQGMNRFGFNGYPSGRRNAEGDGFLPLENYAFYWTSTPVNETTANAMALNYDRDAFEAGDFYKEHGMSVRCWMSGNLVTKVEGEIDSSYIEEIPHQYGSVKIGDKSHKTIKIAGVEWLAENVNYSTGKNWCYGDDKENCKKYGRLYDYGTAKSVCPEGWKLPAKEDFLNLSSLLASRELRAREEWKNDDATDLWGLGFLPAGAYDDGDGFFDRNLTAYFWIDSDSKNNGVQLRYSTESSFNSTYEFKESSGRSVRCVKK